MLFKTSNKVYAHIDCNAFFASCEVLRNPALRGKRVMVGGDIIVAASYEAKRVGIKTGMRSWEARRLAGPEGVFVRQDLSFYGKVSHQLFSYLRTLFSIVTPFSIDEAFVDVTSAATSEEEYFTFAQRLKLDILREIGIPVSIGIGSTHIRAKIFGDQRKPLGETVALSPDTISDIFTQLPITEIPFIGRASGETLRYVVKTIEDFRTLPFRQVHDLLGKNGTDLWLELNGVDIMNFSHPEIPKSISRTRSFNDMMTNDKSFLWERILTNFERAYKDLMSHHLEAGSITLYLRDKELRTYVFPYHFGERTDDRRLLLRTIRDLFLTYISHDIIYRSTGIILGDFRETRPKQLSLLESENMTSEKSKRLATAIERINGKFGKNLVSLGVLKNNTIAIKQKFSLPTLTAS